MFNDEHLVKELASAIQRGNRDEAFVALDVLLRDHRRADVIRHWIDCARVASR